MFAQTVKLIAADGYELGATLWLPSDSAPKTAVVVNCGAGIPASYYAQLASFLARSGIPTLTYDYRGIATSRSGSLRGLVASVEDWGSKDCAAALHALHTWYPQSRIAIVGHSIGGFVTGFVIPNAPRISRYICLAAHTGYWHDYRWTHRFFMFVLWHTTMPVINELFGYFPSRSIGMPADLPYGVAKEWARRLKPDFWWYLRRADGTPDLERIADLKLRFAAHQGTGVLATFSDDPFATDSSSNRLAGLFSAVDFVKVTIRPAELGLRRIGHFGVLSARMEPTIWQRILKWIS